jgi:methyl-accepting chemotaxis protein
MIQRIFSRSANRDQEAAVAAELQECRSKLAAISRSQAVIEFEMDGTIITANDNFLAALGYELSEIVGQHHRIFVEREDAASPEYQQFWDILNRGQFHSGEYMRVRKDGAPIWIHAMYYPVADANGVPVKVVKFASDITPQIVMRQKAGEAGEIVASSIEQMVCTISEISDHVTQTASLATSTKDNVDSTMNDVYLLEQSSQAIENILDLIRGLADQTSLLALNATIESARAGEAGKGFAVVASEVKELAQQTANATKDVDASISEIRRLVAACVESMAQVSNGVATVAESMSSVAGAVEEQNATMQMLNETSEVLRSGSATVHSGPF